MQDEILKHLITILVSIVASVTTTILIYYIKSKRIKVVEQLTSYDERREIIKSVVNNSLYSFALATFITTLELDYYIKLSFIILFCFMTLIFTYSHLRFHSSYLVDALRNRKTRYWLIIISLTILSLWVSALLSIFSIKSLGDTATLISCTLIFLLYTNLFILSIYFKSEVTRVFDKIVVYTLDGECHVTKEVKIIDNFTVIHNSKNDKRIIIPNNQIRLIEYEYKKTSVTDFINQKH